jgi:hypothetical protein
VIDFSGLMLLNTTEAGAMKMIVIISVICILASSVAITQTVEVKAKPLSDTDIQLLRSDVQSAKNEVIAHTMEFTDAESKAFWPLYRDYARDQQTIGDARFQLIKDYAQHYGNMNDSTASNLTHRFIDIESKLVALRGEYWPKFEKALGAKRAAKFYQVDNRLTLMVNLQLASEIPLVP